LGLAFKQPKMYHVNIARNSDPPRFPDESAGKVKALELLKHVRSISKKAVEYPNL
jgi:hypothetical protein